MIDFDDFLGLRSADLSRNRLILFYGRSGSGKSTAIRFLVDRNSPGSFVVIDEVLRLRDLLQVVPILRRARKALVATHVHPIVFRILFPMTRIKAYQTDRDRAKTARYLNERGISASAEAIEAYVRRYGSTYTDADLILERFPSRNFDQAFCRFEKFCRIRITRKM